MSFLYFCFSMFCRSMFCHRPVISLPDAMSFDKVKFIYLLTKTATILLTVFVVGIFFLGLSMQDFDQDNMTKPFYSATDFQPQLLRNERLKFYKYKCDECGKFFTSNWKLQRHSTSHTGLKAFVCDVCYKSFTRKENLVKHKTSAHRVIFYE